MPSNFDPLSLITSPIAGAFNYAGSKEQAHAQERAAQLQANAAQQALDFTKQLKDQQSAAAAPYLSLGQLGVANLPGAVRPNPAGPPPSPYATAPGAMPMGQQTGYSTATITAPSAQAAYGFAPPVPATPQQAPKMATFQGPDGSTRSFAVGSPDYQRALESGIRRVS